MSKNKEYIQFNKFYEEKRKENVDVPVEDAAQDSTPMDVNEAPSEVSTDGSSRSNLDDNANIENTKTNDDVKKEENKTGTVIDCKWLNVRPDPSTTNVPIFSLKDGDNVEILEDSNEEFYKIYASINNVTGYVMKKFIKVK